MAGGGTGGHVIPALAVARELKRRGHEVFFAGTERGVEARMVPAAGFPLELIRIGALKRVGSGNHDRGETVAAPFRRSLHRLGALRAMRVSGSMPARSRRGSG